MKAGTKFTSIVGYTGKDVITGFTGVITGVCSYITGCDQICLSPKVGKDGGKLEGHWIDISRVEKVAGVPRIVLVKPVTKKKTTSPKSLSKPRLARRPGLRTSSCMGAMDPPRAK